MTREQGLRSCASEDSDSNLKRRAPSGCCSGLPVQCSSLGRRSVDAFNCRDRAADRVWARNRQASGHSWTQGTTLPIPSFGTGAYQMSGPQVRHLALDKDGESGSETAGLKPLDSDAACQGRP